MSSAIFENVLSAHLIFNFMLMLLLLLFPSDAWSIQLCLVTIIYRRRNERRQLLLFLLPKLIISNGEWQDGCFAFCYLFVAVNDGPQHHQKTTVCSVITEGTAANAISNISFPSVFQYFFFFFVFFMQMDHSIV